MISVIIPYFKNAQQIERSLKSVIKQTYQDYEIIIINDASPDWHKALAIIEQFKDKRIKTLSHTSNKNGAAARNTGIKAAMGQYIAFLDADDEWMPNHLEILLQVQQENNADLVYSSCTVYSSNNFKYTLPRHSLLESKNLSEYLFCENGFIQTSCLLVKTKIALDNLFNENLKRHQDYDFLLRLENAGVKFFWSKDSSVIVHWEENDIDKKGGTWKYSENWFLGYKKYMSPKARTCFMLKFVIMRLLQNRNIKLGMSKFFRYCRPWHISPKQFYFLISTLLFGKIIIPKK
ncbi:glycosyltransferase family 2 protein [uncultured Winogradskyella sp.]|mgnify:CR=1 FL=1|uniref:glycosyltransferase family 2 protein n=1 Tax=uncultured Winogradskyella sp. TaxID=395353 RepID=UPI003519B022